jgi:hypothetical protein
VAFAIYMIKYLKAKEELWKLKYFTMQKDNLSKNPPKETKILQKYYNSIINLKFQHKPKYHLSKILILIIDLVPRGRYPLSYYTL